MPPGLPPFFRLRSLARVDSTNDVARALASEGAPEGTLVVAEEQSAGRGRERRTWVSPKGNLYASLVLRPAADVRKAAQLGFAAALAAIEAAEAVLPPGASLALKWPNDVLLGGAKTAGILLESHAPLSRHPRESGGPEASARHSPWVPASAGTTELEWLVLGIGVNLASAPSDTEFPATHLAAWGASVTPGDFLPILAGRLVAWYEAWRRDGFGAVRAAWLARAHAPGAPIRVRHGGREECGRFAGLDAEGRLLFDGPAGRATIAAADVFPAAS
jgi:BirA family biotin operon repressor/biotin-[acetyl-CoA-carboxylase] ligase